MITFTASEYAGAFESYLVTAHLEDYVVRGFRVQIRFQVSMYRIKRDKDGHKMLGGGLEYFVNNY